VKDTDFQRLPFGGLTLTTTTRREPQIREGFGAGAAACTAATTAGATPGASGAGRATTVSGLPTGAVVTWLPEGTLRPAALPVGRIWVPGVAAGLTRRR
jgi:hypothetical protein